MFGKGDQLKMLVSLDKSDLTDISKLFELRTKNHIKSALNKTQNSTKLWQVYRCNKTYIDEKRLTIATNFKMEVQV